MLFFVSFLRDPNVGFVKVILEHVSKALLMSGEVKRNNVVYCTALYYSGKNIHFFICLLVLLYLYTKLVYYVVVVCTY